SVVHSVRLRPLENTVPVPPPLDNSMRNQYPYCAVLLILGALLASACGSTDDSRSGPTGAGGAPSGARGGGGDLGSTGGGSPSPAPDAGAGTGGSSGEGGGAGAGGGDSDGGMPPDGGNADGGVMGNSGPFTVTGLATWKYDAKAVYTIIHDD